jgi:hypothetical protein
MLVLNQQAGRHHGRGLSSISCYRFNMSAVMIDVDPTCPEPPFEIGKVFRVTGTTELPKDITERPRLIICLVGSADVLLQMDRVETFKLTKPSAALLVEAGVAILSVGGPDNQLTMIYSGA